jgi:hypothetical protein
MYEYMSWHVLLACIVSMYCTDCIVSFCILGEENYTILGPLGMGGSVGGGGKSGCSTPPAPVALVRPGPGLGGGGCLLGCM